MGDVAIGARETDVVDYFGGCRVPKVSVPVRHESGARWIVEAGELPQRLRKISTDHLGSRI
jgi:hypothetical protein